MKRPSAQSPKGIWSDAENSLLARLAQGAHRKNWNAIAEELNEKCRGSKTGKQCRERYRNYEDPKLEKASWKVQEKLLFTILHQLYGNHWSGISKCLNRRSDVVIKNYFYRKVRKVTKHINVFAVPNSFLKTPEKFYRFFSVLTHIKNHYLPDVQRLGSLPKYGSKEHTILKLLQDRGITETGVKKYQDLMIKYFRVTFHSSHFPIVIFLSLDSFKISDEEVGELKKQQCSYNVLPLCQMVYIRIVEKNGFTYSAPPNFYPWHYPSPSSLFDVHSCMHLPVLQPSNPFQYLPRSAWPLPHAISSVHLTLLTPSTMQLPLGGVVWGGEI
eukprot:TRINITY_DN7198_c0_g1_i7.p1 TRINITY_DN7198_c0_g1~~TRINITY_DN7198_c0_g1_i7.p1  ORF type:complete len:368 (+),score=37.57 TRINITY_DN7198_c0_g1_i7:123-1106(+)